MHEHAGHEHEVGDHSAYATGGERVEVLERVFGEKDLLPYLGFDMDEFRRNLRKVNPAAEVLLVSARTGEGVDAWCDWLRAWL